MFESRKARVDGKCRVFGTCHTRVAVPPPVALALKIPPLEGESLLAANYNDFFQNLQ